MKLIQLLWCEMFFTCKGAFVIRGFMLSDWGRWSTANILLLFRLSIAASSFNQVLSQLPHGTPAISVLLFTLINAWIAY